MTTKTGEIFGLGQCSLDYIGQIDAYPAPDVKCEMSGLVVGGGGPVATALVALSRWGKGCYFAGEIGDDQPGRLILQSLREEGIDTGGVVLREGYSSQQAFILAEPKTARRTIFWQRPTGPPLRPEEVDLAALARAKVIHTDGLLIEAALFACRKAREKGLAVVVDGGTLRQGMIELARLSDYCIVSEGFARQLVGEDNPREACRIIAELGPRLAAVTLGERGYIALARGIFLERPAYQVPAVDTTGCGDIFHAGFIYGLTEGWTIEQSLDLGAWAAARVSLALGGRRAIPSLAEALAHHRGQK
ncbi:MAG: PfkB family carbohydrate kinase [Smithellaceae bacterium]|nr:PfkB family carbohydrate kinase [Smithellaceae bacterium]